MTVGFEIPLLIWMALIVPAAWYINTHREREPLYKRKRRHRRQLCPPTASARGH